MGVVNIGIEICNTALGLIGADEINSFQDETREARRCASLYPRIARSRMEMYPWRFTMTDTRLSKLVGVTPTLKNFESAFQLPGDRLRAVNKPYSGLNYRIMGDQLYANGDYFDMEYQYRAPEELWTESFRHMMELEMAGILSIALFEDDKKSLKYTQQGGLIDRQTRIAKSVDGQQQAADTLDESNFTLVGVR